MNIEALEFSRKYLPSQIAYIKEKRPYISAVTLIDTDENMKADYLCGVDAVANGISGEHYNLQFKARKNGNNDFFLIVKKLTGQSAMNGNIGFTYGKAKYTFELLHTDIFIETINGKHYSISREEINAIEKYYSSSLEDYISNIVPRYIEKDNGDNFFSDYYCFIPAENLNTLRKNIF